MEDTKYMHLALQLAKKGYGYVNPNPMVGAVLVKNGRIIGQGYHEKYGGHHAELNAIESCSESPIGSTLYVTLEPCCHIGKNPPCTDAILKSGIEKVVIGSGDPNPLVAGKGIELLCKKGVKVVEGVLKAECDKLNEVFFHYIQTGNPFVVMKYAMTLDGKTAAYTGKSKWITGEIARHRVHQDRHRYSAIMTGIGTVLADNSLLTCRIENGRNPIRIICDTHLRTQLDFKVVTTAKDVPTIIATSCDDLEKHKPYQDAGCCIMHISQKDGHLDLGELMKKLGEKKIDSILLEGGSTLNWSALQAGIVKKVQAYIAPKILGGINSKTPVAGMGVESPNEAFFLTNSIITNLGEDILIESEVARNVHWNY
ncbi:bifunctional diaminohydroxyphosphoribosylaminopyrimidine deaminase/5-amino-6-(5-phosphoribosylamino)uracil reductase RibD [Sedimentibacter sp. MB31-C6]|uniref:bifunctional diaminohydroxyphosphoribosylaminopyrimidine deaminase/5-amino-6-(5-phosphoribosylamino)uracil reductase RibD n=1 Tax=Sedimentibacter sp. MB31-C6 TaxID=3109366 RepID=UPI002DDC9647|nr:bifunctional diaminohydroxyphosphoribosylaminopyrimidine deaminase/5-amino-6-(5-phosphoribosylamino)uracil reductase RibD [Sedimentibacter sp. MB36-C1]WSI05617.1 bifunctional diaminohydroxyphosphoribosylaminopyrimidine deaminase/5-amino-6-(5-phosphoribosylamino)uracil reductase RibD [Sedimentibacter sp. MB36-C1]